MAGRADPEERWRSRVVEQGTCLVYPTSRDPLGYAKMYVAGRMTYVHRWAYEHFVEPIPEGWHVDHLCRNTSCCLPSHLEAVTPGENTARTTAVQTAAARKLARTHCSRGHALTGTNLAIVTIRGYPTRVCRACRAQDQARSRARRRMKEEK